MGDRRRAGDGARGRGHLRLASCAALHRGSAPRSVLREGPATTGTGARLPARSRVAHNAGNNLETLTKALRYGADVIEIDVIFARGQLVAGRSQPLPQLARRLFRGPTLAEAWDRAAVADIVKLDLKQTDRGFLDELIAFLTQRAKSRRVMISSGDQGALLYLHSRLPGVTMLFSVGAPDAVHEFQPNGALQKAIGGASVFQGLVDASLVAWAHQHKLLILAWTVNDSQHFNQLVRLGVDGITTANLAILRALG